MVACRATYAVYVQFLPPTNEVCCRVMLSRVFVCPQGGVVKGEWDRHPSDQEADHPEPEADTTDPEVDIPWTQRQTIQTQR